MKRINKCISFFLMTIIVTGSINILSVTAGASHIVVDNSSFEKELDSTLWNNMEGDVQIQNKALVFPKESTDATKLITRVDARISEAFDSLVDVTTTMTFTQLPDEKKFILALGLASVEAEMGEPGNVEIAFVNEGGLKVSVKAYDLDGNAVALADNVNCGSVNGNTKVDAGISTKGLLTVKVRGKEVCQAQLPCSGEGRVGFLQTGSCGVTITDLYIASYKYDTPENCNVFEDFEKEAINTNTLTARITEASPTYAPTRLTIQKIDGNRALLFENSSTTYIGTQYKYSNFEMTFDVVYLQRINKEDEEGNVVIPKSDTFAVSFGDEAADYATNTWGYDSSSEVIAFVRDSSIQSIKTEQVAYADAKGYAFFHKDCDKKFSVKVSVIDSVVTVGMKWLEEEKFTEIIKYNLAGKTPLGYVHIWTMGTNDNLAIDNLSIINKDANPKLLDVDYKSALIEKPADFNYQPMEAEYLKVKEKKEFNPFLIIPIVAGVCVVAVIADVMIGKAKKTNKKGEQ